MDTTTTTEANGVTAMTDIEIRETIRQMLADWDAATPAQRAEALAIAADGAARAHAALIASAAQATGHRYLPTRSGKCEDCGRPQNILSHGVAERPWIRATAPERDLSLVPQGARAWTDREAAIIDEHVADFRKEHGRAPDRGEMIEMFAERGRESAIGEAIEFDAIVANFRAM